MTDKDREQIYMLFESTLGKLIKVGEALKADVNPVDRPRTADENARMKRYNDTMSKLQAAAGELYL